MASRIVLHIGQQKSGTTYLQGALGQCDEHLAALDTTYPLPPPHQGRTSVVSHERATYGLLGTEYPWVSEQRAEGHRGAWQALQRAVRSWDGTALISAEALSVVRAPAIRRLIDALGGGDVEVVVTVRHPGKFLPSSWQQHIRNGKFTSFEHYMRTMAAQRERSDHDIETEPELTFWRAFAPGGLVGRWGAEVGHERVSVVTNPGSPPELLWSRFVEAAGLPELAERVPSRPLRIRTHSGLTAPETQVLAGLNAALRRAGWQRAAANRLRRCIVVNGFQKRAERGPAISIPEPWRERVAAWSRADIAELCGAGVRIVGDIDDLRYEPDRDGKAKPSHRDLERAAAAAILAAHERSTERRPKGRLGRIFGGGA